MATLNKCRCCRNTFADEHFSEQEKVCDFCCQRHRESKIREEEKRKQWRLDNPEKVN